MSGFTDPEGAVRYLRLPVAIRNRCGFILARAHEGRLRHFALDRARLSATARYVAEVTRATYPDLRVPFHSRWRHFEAGGRDRWAEASERFGARGSAERARRRFDLVIPSVFLDAGAGASWRYREAGTGRSFARSEGLALASFDLFMAGGLSGRAKDPLRADASRLRTIGESELARAFQAGEDNPLTGLAGRLILLHRLGEAAAARPDLFGAAAPRLGALYDHLAGRAAGGRIAAAALFAVLVEAFGPVWPGGAVLGGVALGDVWRHPAAATGDLTSELVPFHKLSQWLAYSLVEPLEEAGISVVGLDALTGLAEYRNGGLLVDMGVLHPLDPGLRLGLHPVSSEAIVEWRALTVALIDLVAERVRMELGLSEGELPLAKVLEGGTWRAGRLIAAERRADGGPPISVDSDGTVF